MQDFNQIPKFDKSHLFVLLSGGIKSRARFAFVLFLHLALRPLPPRSKQKEREVVRLRKVSLALVPLYLALCSLVLTDF